MTAWIGVALTTAFLITAESTTSPHVFQQEIQASTLEDIEVLGAQTRQQVRERVDSFVESNMASPRGRPLARWNKPVCVGTAYLQAPLGQAIIDRVSRRIIEVGGDVAGPGCQVDVLVLGTTDGALTASSLVRDNPRSFRPSRGSTDRGSEALKDFQQGEAPVRWWHVSLPVNIDTGEIAVRLDGEDIPFTNVRDASRLRTNVRDDLARITIIVDFDKMPANVLYTALADYVAFIALAQVNPNGDSRSEDTILNLFEAPEGMAGLTQWDVDYLSGLYRADQNRPSIDAQTRGIAHEVLNQRRQR